MSCWMLLISYCLNRMIELLSNIIVISHQYKTLACIQSLFKHDNGI